VQCFVEHSDSMTLDTSTTHCAVYALLHCNSMKSFTHTWEGGRDGGRENRRWRVAGKGCTSRASKDCECR